METTKTFKLFTVSKADMFHTGLNTVVFSLEASHANHRVLCREIGHLKVINAVNLVEHETAEIAREYVKSLEK